MKELESLVARARSPNASLAQQHDAFGRLIARFQDMAYGFAYAILGNAQLAEDAAQEAFLIAYQNLEQLRDPKAFPGWFKRIILSTVLEQAAQEGQLATLELLLVDGFDVNAKGRNGQTLLHWAARTGHLDAIKVLVRGGADVNMPDRFGRTPLHSAIEGSQREAALRSPFLHSTRRFMGS